MNQLAMNSIKVLTDAANAQPKAVPPRKRVPKEVHRIMSEMGRKGGKIGGATRAARMTRAERSNAAALAANARWAAKRRQTQPPES
jgi:hypothetical protein